MAHADGPAGAACWQQNENPHRASSARLSQPFSLRHGQRRTVLVVAFADCAGYGILWRSVRTGDF